jgi:hypothetical protein
MWRRCGRESRRERPGLQREGCSLPATPPQDYPSRRCSAATHSNSSSLSRPQLHRPALSTLRHNQHVASQSVQARNANSSSLSDMFTLVATIFQQIMRELNGAEAEEDRIMAITKIVLNLVGCWCSKRQPCKTVTNVYCC